MKSHFNKLFNDTMIIVDLGCIEIELEVINCRVGTSKGGGGGAIQTVVRYLIVHMWDTTTSA